MQINLRDYQQNAVEKLRDNMRSGIKSQLLCVPTGGGKTVIASSIIHSAIKKGSNILFLAHRKALITQCAAKLEDFGVLNYSIIMAGSKMYNSNAKVHVASIQTLMRREFPKADLIVIDEAHRAASKSYRDILSNYPKAAVLGLSATPERTDGKGLDDLFQEMVTVTTVSKLINDGFLIKPTLYTGRFDSTQLGSVKKRQGDYAEGELQEMMDKPKLIGDIITNWRQKANDRLTVVFACGVEHAEHIAQEFFNAGISAASVTQKTSKVEYDAIVSDWRKGIIKVVVNCMIFTEGFDLPELSCCVFARPTKSISLYLQMIGRIMRSAPGKIDAVVLDHAGCIEEHGAPHLDREWTLTGESDRKGKESGEALENCKCCDMVFNPEPKAYLLDVQDKLLDELKPKAVAAMKKRADRALTSCPGCGVATCRVCNEQFPLKMEKVDIDGIAFLKSCACPSCHAAYSDEIPHMPSEENEKELPQTARGELSLYESEELPLSVRVKNSFRKHLNDAKSKGFKRGYAFHKVVSEFGDEAKQHIPRHTGEWYRKQA
jgi:DNA repair protein RadD